jgi:hypothetical protein
MTRTVTACPPAERRECGCRTDGPCESRRDASAKKLRAAIRGCLSGEKAPIAEAWWIKAYETTTSILKS